MPDCCFKMNKFGDRYCFLFLIEIFLCHFLNIIFESYFLTVVSKLNLNPTKHQCVQAVSFKFVLFVL